MKETMKKISAVLKTIFGYGIMLVLLAGGLTFAGYDLRFKVNEDVLTVVEVNKV